MKNYFYALMMVSYGLSACFATAMAQVSVQWDKTFLGDNYDILTSAIPTADGGYLLGGESNSDGRFDKSENNKSFPDYLNDYWVIKTDKNGKKLWDRTYGGEGYDFLSSIVPTADGGYLLAGASSSDISGDKSEEQRGDFDYWIIKTDMTGKKKWDKTFGGNDSDELKKVIATADGGYLLAGNSYSKASGDKSENSRGELDYWVVKVNKDGIKQWDKTIGGNGYDWLSSVVPTADGGYLLAGYSDSGKSGNKTQNSKGVYDYWIVKLDKNGKQRWDKTLGGKGYDNLMAAIATADGGYLLAGASDSDVSGNKSENSRGYTDYWIIKTDKNGNKLWDRTIGGNDSDELTTLIATGDGGYLLAGNSYSEASKDKSENTKGIYDFWLVKTDNKGKKLWDKTIGGNLEDVPNQIVSTTDGGYLLAGVSSSTESGDKSTGSKGVSDYWIVKVAETAPEFTVSNFTLINANTNHDITALSDGDVIDLAQVNNAILSIRANTQPTKVDRIKFELVGPFTHKAIENFSPYALFGDELKSGSADYNGKQFVPGQYKLKVTPYMNGKAGKVSTILFSVTNTSNARVAALQVDVYPVPTSGVVHIQHKGADTEANMTLLDFAGNALLSQTLQGQSERTLDLSAYKKGFYFLKIVGKEGVETKRIVIE